MDVHLRTLAAAQVDLVAAWQLVERGWTRKRVRRRSESGNWKEVYDGVFALTQAPLTPLQRLFGATLTAPNTFLTHGSSAHTWAFANREPPAIEVVRPGSGGPRTIDGLRVYRSRELDGETTNLDGLPITTPARALIDISARLHPLAVGRAFREALRLGPMTARNLAAALDRHRGRRGTRVLWHLAERYGGLPYRRCRSNAEARALEVLQDASCLPDKVNAQIAGEEADLIWLGPKWIVEIDGPQFHLFRDEDERKQGLWEAAGYTVRRIPSQLVYDDPAALIALVPQ